MKTWGDLGEKMAAGSLYLRDIREMMLAAYLLRGYYQPAGPLIQPPSKTGPECGPRDLPSSRGIEEPPDNPSPMGYSRGFPPYQSSFYPPAGYYPPPPPQPAHYQPPQPTSYHQHYHHHQELCYPPGYPPGPYPPPPGPYRRYLAAPPSGYHPPDLTYSSSASSASPSTDHPVQQMVVPGGSSTYPPPLDHYPHPSSGSYCPPYPPGPAPPCYSHPAGPTRNLPFMETFQSCPCPMQSCPKNVHTGPLTGECKRSGALSLPPVALALPKEPPGATGPPSPARGSAGVAPLPSPAGNWPTASPDLPPGPPTGLLAISQTATAASPASPPAKRKADRRDETSLKKRMKRCNENAGVDKKPPRKEPDPIVLKDRNVEVSATVLETAKERLDTIAEVIEDVVSGYANMCNSPPVLERVRDVTKRPRKISPKPPTLTPAVQTTCLTLVSQHKTKKKRPCPGDKSAKQDEIISEPAPIVKPEILETTTPVVTEKSRKRPRKILLPLPPKPFTGTPRWSNGWTWAGKSFDAKVYITNDDVPVLRRCFPAMQHTSGDTIRRRDCVLLKAGARKTDLPFVAKISALWENPDDGEMMISLLWYYRPEHTEQGRRSSDQIDEIFASRHRDVNSVACIEDRCFVLTFNEYCRYRRHVKAVQCGLEERSVVPQKDNCPEQRLPPGIVAPELVLFCRKVYDFRQKRLLKNPTA